MKYLTILLITFSLLFTGCTTEDDENITLYEDGSIDFPYNISDSNQSSTYTLDYGSNYFNINNLDAECLITFETIYNDYSDFDLYQDPYSNYYYNLTDFLEIQDFSINSTTGELSFTYKVLHKEYFTVILYMYNNSFAKVKVSC